MIGASFHRISFLLAAPLVLSALVYSAAPDGNRIERARYTDPRQYGFLAAMLPGVEVVSLGESIHLTHEFPLIRLGMVRYLNESAGFRVLAMEGSAVDVWATQDRLMNSARTATDIGDAQLGLFGIWNTPEMRQLFEYEARSWNTSTPFYIAAYDIQPGSGVGTHGSEAFSLLADRLAAYAAPPQGFDRGAWIKALSVLANSCQEYSAGSDAGAEQGIALLEQWISSAAPVAEKRFASLPHGAVLRLLPENLRASLALCRGLGGQQGKDWGRYKRTRDTNAAAFALRLKEISPGGKVMLWAHVSHVFYDSEHTNTSVGELLHDRLGPALYTVGVFAEGGGTIVLFSDVNDLIGYAPVYAPFGELRRTIDAACSSDCFMNLRGTNDDLLLSPHRVWFESMPRPMRLARDFDAVVWVKHVHAPDFSAGKFLVLATLAYRMPAAGVVVIIAGGLLWRRMRKRGGGAHPEGTEKSIS